MTCKSHNGKQTARVIVYGYKVCQLFPPSAVQIIHHLLLFGEESSDKDTLVKAFKCFVAEGD